MGFLVFPPHVLPDALSSLSCTAPAHSVLEGGAAITTTWGLFWPTPVLVFIFLDNREVWKREAHGKPVFAGRAVNVVRVLGKKLSMAGTRPGGCKCRAMSISYH